MVVFPVDELRRNGVNPFDDLTNSEAPIALRCLTLALFSYGALAIAILSSSTLSNPGDNPILHAYAKGHYQDLIIPMLVGGLTLYVVARPDEFRTRINALFQRTLGTVKN